MGFFSTIKKMWKTEDTSVEGSKTTRDEQPVVTATQGPAQKDQSASPARPESQEEFEKELSQALQQAEPRLSVWLDLILHGVDKADQTLWNRLAFLLRSLEVPDQEADEFLRRFQQWLEDMGYDQVVEFRSELQYRLALALDLEDEEDEQSRLFLKLSQGLSKTKEQLSRRIDQLLSFSQDFDDAFWEELEEIGRAHV